MKRFGGLAVIAGAVAASLLLGVGAASALAAQAPAAGSAAEATDSPAGKTYVALGDSYSAGFGLTPFSDEPASGCYQADQNYPHLVAESLGLVLEDRTCSGAVTANIRDTPQVTITGAGTAPVQSDALGPDTDIVTVTIGGNDLGFSTVAETCVAESATGPLVLDAIGVGLQNCKQYYAPVIDGIEVDRLKYLLDNTVTPALDETFALIRSKAPNAKVFVIGYPAITPDAANTPEDGCYSSPLGTGSDPLAPPFPQNAFPFTDVDTLYLHSTEARLDTAIGEAFINGIGFNATSGTPTPDPDLFVTLGALHPNTTGVAFLAEQVSQSISSAFEGEGAGDPDPTTTPTPVPSPEPSTAPAAAGDPRGPGLAATGTGALALGVSATAILMAGLAAILWRRRSAKP